MSNQLSPLNPERFGLASFADLLPRRDPIIGEDPGSFAGFHDGMMRSLAPFTPYECVVAENLIAIEWELLQHRRMREAGLRNQIRSAVRDATVAYLLEQYERSCEEAWEDHVARGGDEENWEEPDEFDLEAAGRKADDLAERATSHDRDVQADAQMDMVGIGLSPLDLMGAAYRSRANPAMHHDEKSQELERRRRDVNWDYDALQKTRPVDGEIIDA